MHARSQKIIYSDPVFVKKSMLFCSQRLSQVMSKKFTNLQPFAAVNLLDLSIQSPIIAPKIITDTLKTNP